MNKPDDAKAHKLFEPDHDLGACDILSRDILPIWVGLKRFLDDCFAAVWPKAIHGFAALRPSLLRDYPFDSVDSASWVSGPMKYGSWPGLGNLRVRNIKVPLTPVVRYYERMERESEGRWAKELEKVRAA